MHLLSRLLLIERVGSKGEELDGVFCEGQAIHSCKGTLLHLHLHKTLLGVVLDLLDVAKVLFRVEAPLAHPIPEVSLLWKEGFFEFVPTPLCLDWLWRFFWLWLLLGDIFFGFFSWSICQFAFSDREDNEILIFLDLEKERSIKEALALEPDYFLGKEGLGDEVACANRLAIFVSIDDCVEDASIGMLVVGF